MADYISECRFVPIGNSCLQNDWTINFLKREISEGKPLVKVLIWDHNGEIIEVLSMANYRSKVLTKSKERHSIPK
jgi:hypothetical protein